MRWFSLSCFAFLAFLADGTAQSQDPASYKIQDGLTAWDIGGYLGDYQQISATTYYGNLVIFLVQVEGKQFDVFPYSTTFSQKTLLNTSTPDTRPDPNNPYAFDRLTSHWDAGEFTFSNYTGGNLLTSTVAFDGKVYLYVAVGGDTTWWVKSYSAPPLPAPTPPPTNPTPTPTPPAPRQVPLNIREGTWDSGFYLPAPKPIQAMAATVGQDAHGEAVSNVWMAVGDSLGNSIEQFSATPTTTGGAPDGDNLTDVLSFFTPARIISLSATPITFAQSSGGKLVQFSGTFIAYATIEDTGNAHFAIVPRDDYSPVLKVLPLDDSLFEDINVSSVNVAAGTVENGTPGVNAVQVFVTHGDQIMRAEYLIPQDPTLAPSNGSWTLSQPLNPLFQPYADLEGPGTRGPALLSRLFTQPSGIALFTATDVIPDGEGISRLADSLVLLGTNSDRNRNTLSALIVGSNITVPYGVHAPQPSLANPTPTPQPPTPDLGSDPMVYSDKAYIGQWDLLGIVTGLPPYKDGLVSKFSIEAEKSVTNQFKTTATAAISAGIVTDDDLDISTDDRLTYSYFYSKSQSLTQSNGEAFAFSNMDQDYDPTKGWMFVLYPRVLTQLYKVCDWAGTPINLAPNGTTDGEYTYYVTTPLAPQLGILPFDITDPGKPENSFAAGFPALFDTSMADDWSPSVYPLSTLKEGTAGAFGAQTSLDIPVGVSGSTEWTFDQTSATELENENEVEVDLSVTTFDVYTGAKGSVTISNTTTTEDTLKVTFSIDDSASTSPSSYYIKTFGYTLNNDTNPNIWVPTAFQPKVLYPGNEQPFLFSYTVSPNPSATDPGGLPKFTVAPVSQTLGIGKSGLLFATLEDPTGVTYQWFKNGQPVPNAINDTLSFSTVGPSDAGRYYLEATNSSGATRSRSAIVKVVDRPTITRQPHATGSARPGDALRFDVAATNVDPNGYQWFVNGQAVPGATQARFDFRNIPSSLAPYATIFARASNAAGTATSRMSRLNVALPPTIFLPPAATTVRVGDTAVFEIGATSENPIFYTWTRDDVEIQGVTGPKLTMPSVSLADDGAHIAVTVSNVGGKTTSAPVRLSVVKAASFPGASILRGSQSVNAGRNAVFSIQLVGNASIQWLKDGVAVRGATGATLHIPKAGAGDEGLYTVRLTNSEGSTEVVVGRLAVLKAPPTFLVEPRSRTASPGDRVALLARVAGSGVTHYRWLRDGKPVDLPGVSGRGTHRLVFEKILPIHAGQYVLEAWNAFGTTRSRVVRVSVR